MTYKDLDPGDGVAEVRRGLTEDDEQASSKKKSPLRQSVIFLRSTDGGAGRRLWLTHASEEEEKMIEGERTEELFNKLQAVVSQYPLDTGLATIVILLAYGVNQMPNAAELIKKMACDAVDRHEELTRTMEH